MKKYLQDIAEEKQGFSFGESWRYDEDSLVSLLPILRKTSAKKNYLLFSESDKTEVRDSGMINKVEVYNGEELPVYIRMGEIFTGKTQERSAVRSYLIMPKEKVQVEVRCIYASKGINTAAPMTSGGVVSSSLDSMFASSSFKDRGVEQRDVWQSVHGTSQNLCAMSEKISQTSPTDIPEMYKATDDLKSNLDDFATQIEHILSKVPYFETQVGIATLDLKGVNGIECFDLPQSWKKMRDAIIKKEGEHIAKQEKDSPFEYNQKKAIRSVKGVLSLVYEERPVFKSKDYIVTALQGDGYVGEIVELNGDLIHLTIIRK